MIAGFCMSLVSSPIDVVKTRIMNSRDSAGAKSYSGMFDCLYKVELPMPLIYLLCHQQQDAHTLNRRLERKDCWDYIRDLCRHSCDWVHISLSLSLSLSLFLFLSLLFIFSINRTSYHHGIHYLRGFTKLGGNRSRVMLRQRKEVLNQHFYTFWVVF
mgnify:FL=1